MKKKLIIGLGALVGLVATFAFAKGVVPLSWGVHDEYYSERFSDRAINGYDAVEYHLERKAVQGNEQLVYSWKGVNWYFSSESNKQLFMGQPENYAPVYGGYCAYAHTKGFTANIDPHAFDLVDGKLYFFADDKVKKDWREETAGQ